MNDEEPLDDPAGDGLTIAEVAAATGTTAHTLRYYERAGLIHPIARTSTNRRRYAPTDVAWVEFLLRLRATGMPIAWMQEYAVLRAEGPDTVRQRLLLLQEHQAALREQIAALHDHDVALSSKIAAYRLALTETEAPKETT
ncbi:MAG: MerR family transcriptional regulator [Gordonia sp. (in: high G+C Gram-positive bacteria)]